jgi:hypothetical protein
MTATGNNLSVLSEGADMTLSNSTFSTNGSGTIKQLTGRTEIVSTGSVSLFNIC